MSPTLPAIPLFTLAGFLLAEGHASERLLRVFRALFGWILGGTAVVCAVLCSFFTVFTGGSGVTILALGGVLIILGVAVGLTNYLVNAQVPAALVQWARAHIWSRPMFLLALNVFLLAVGWLMEIFAAIVVVVPLIVPLGAAFGIHPVHLGIIFIANLELGFLTPLVGLNIFLASYRFKRPVLEVCRAALPAMAMLGIGVLIITYVPWLTTGLLAILGRSG